MLAATFRHAGRLLARRFWLWGAFASTFTLAAGGGDFAGARAFGFFSLAVLVFALAVESAALVLMEERR